MLAALSAAIEAREPSTRGHGARVAALVEAVAQRLGWDEEQVAALRLGATLHDVGKLAVPIAVLRKRGPLVPEELAQIRVHPSAGARLLATVAGARAAVPCVLHHHERWDGRGYPAGLAGEAIPPNARLLAVADAFDAMTTHRSYRRALAAPRALAELDRCAGSQFDPRLTDAFLDVWGATARAAG